MPTLSYSRLNRTIHFGKNHWEEDRQMEKVCSMCNEQSYCTRRHDT